MFRFVLPIRVTVCRAYRCAAGQTHCLSVCLSSHGASVFLQWPCMGCNWEVTRHAGINHFLLLVRYLRYERWPCIFQFSSAHSQLSTLTARLVACKSLNPDSTNPFRFFGRVNTSRALEKQFIRVESPPGTYVLTLVSRCGDPRLVNYHFLRR